MDSKQHYDQFLGALYSWMVGDFDEAVRQARDQLTSLGVEAGSHRFAVDLGCGHGVFAMALAQWGYQVDAVDNCQMLLKELESRMDGWPIHVHESDLITYLENGPQNYSVAVCLGDTITHLPGPDAVQRLLSAVKERLLPGGVLLLTFRDYTGAPPVGPLRFVPVRSDADRILTCVLDYGATHVDVTDLVHERIDNSWRLRASTYRKLRLAPEGIAENLRALGFAVQQSKSPRGMVQIRAHLGAANA